MRCTRPAAASSLLGDAHLIHHRHQHVVRNVGLEQQRRVRLLGKLLLELREVLGELREVVALRRVLSIRLSSPTVRSPTSMPESRTVISSWKLGGSSLGCGLRRRQS